MGLLMFCLNYILTYRAQIHITSALALAGALMASFGNMASQVAQRKELPVVQSNAWSMLYGASFTAVLAVVGGQPFTFEWSRGYVLSLDVFVVAGFSLVLAGNLLVLMQGSKQGGPQ